MLLPEVLKQYLMPPELPYAIRDDLDAVPCLLFHEPFFALNVAAMPTYFERTVAALQPPPWLRSVVDEWHDENGVAAGDRVIAVHLRLTDNLNRGLATFAWVDRCANDAKRSDAINELLAFLHSRSIDASVDKLTLLLATDDLASACAQAVLAAFPRAKLLVVGAPPASSAARFSANGDCLHSEFTQEVLARHSVAFFGSGMSTFSSAIHQIRTLRYGQPVNSSLLV
jgi:hypothetical protein